MKEVNSHDEMLKLVQDHQRALVLLYKKGSEQSECAHRNFSKAAQDRDDIMLAAADVSRVRDIHPVYNITSAPTVIEFHHGEFRNVIKGCHDWQFFKAVMDDVVYSETSPQEEKPSHRVTVYSTPSCSWCTTLKTYLRKQRIRYTEVDVSRDENALQDMVRKSGQQGVPQTDIDGQMIVGFDKTRINTLLGIQG